MTDAISMEDFIASKKEATNLTDDERIEADLEQSMEQANELLDFITEATDANPETLYFIWLNINHILIDALGWTREELQKDIEDVEVCLEEDSK